MKTLQQPQCSMCGCTGQGCNQQGADLGGAPLQLQCAAAFEEDCNQAGGGSLDEYLLPFEALLLLHLSCSNNALQPSISRTM